MERSLKLLVLLCVPPPFEKVPPLTFPPWSGCGSGSKRIRDAEPDLCSFRVNGCSHPMSPRRGRAPGVQGGDTSYPTMPDGANRSLSVLRMDPRGTTEGEPALCSSTALVSRDVGSPTGTKSARAAGATHSGCISARSSAVTAHHPKLVIHVPGRDLEESNQQT